MVRLEKIIYEQALHGLTRANAISTPRKWFHAHPYEHLRLVLDKMLNHSIFGYIVKPIFKWFTLFEMRYNLDIYQQRGLTFQDKLLHLDKELRRGVLFEHIARETLHPYHWILKARRRERHAKVQYALAGFFVPEYLRAEAGTQTFYDFLKLQKEWSDHLYQNYYSEMTPIPHRSTVPKVIPLEFLQNFGVLRREAWERYFMNEHGDKWCEEWQLQAVRDKRTFPFNLTTQEGKKEFENYMTELNEKVPGAFAPLGQKFDFKAYYAEIGV